MGVMIPLESFFLVTLQKKLNNDYKRKEQDYMPLRLPDKLPAIELLKHENIFVMDESRAHSQEIRPLKICVLNLMPLKITTETDLVRLLSNTPLQIEVCFMKLKSHTPKNTPIEHMMMFYKDSHELSKQKFDGMIVTGAPIETMEYEDVQYWDEITEIFDWARTHVTSTLYICWGAQAGLYHFYGCLSISSTRRCSASSLRSHWIRRSLSSEVSMTSSICRTAAIPRCAVRTLRRCRDSTSLPNRQKAG